jgi:hypothetical protein
VATWEDVRAIAGALPEAEESTSYGRPAFRVRKKTFAWLSPHEDDALVVRVDADESAALLEARRDLFFTTPHYERSAMLLIRLADVDADALREPIEDSWLLAAPPKLAATLD